MSSEYWINVYLDCMISHSTKKYAEWAADKSKLLYRIHVRLK